MKGLYSKYQVTKTSGNTDPGAAYFVLRLDTDGHARDAVRFYAGQITNTSPRLAQELTDWCDRLERNSQNISLYSDQ